MSGSVVETERPEQDTTAQDAQVEIEVPAPRRIEIIGFTESRAEAHWGDPTWEKWVCNNLYLYCPNEWHRVYDIHAIKDIQTDAQHSAFLGGAAQNRADGGGTVSLDGRPVYVMHTPPEDWKTAHLLPKDDCVSAFGNYFTNSISWMIAHAMLEIRQAAGEYADGHLIAAGDHAKQQGEGAYELFKEAAPGLHAALMHDYEAQCAIHIYGVDMATTSNSGGNGEYQNQRPSCEYILGIAKGRGIEIHVPMSSDLLKTSAMYGADDDSALRAKLVARQDELTKRMRQVQAEIEQKTTIFHQLQGAAENNQYYLTVWTNTRAERDGSSKNSNDAPTSEAQLQEAA